MSPLHLILTGFLSYRERAELDFKVFGQPDCTSDNIMPVSASSRYYPNGIALDSNGNLYVGDTMNHRVLRYDNSLLRDTFLPAVIRYHCQVLG
jgi:hypothetical protein